MDNYGFMKMVPDKVEVIKSCDVSDEYIDQVKHEILDICKNTAIGYINENLGFSFDMMTAYVESIINTVKETYNGRIKIRYTIDPIDRCEAHLIIAILEAPPKKEEKERDETHKYIIVINGRGGIGKDTMIEKYSSRGDHKVHNISSIDPVKAIAEFVDGYDSEVKDKRTRLLLSEMKQSLIKFDDIPLKYLISETEGFLHVLDDCDIMFVHIREWSEIQKYMEYIETKYPDGLFYNVDHEYSFVHVNTLLCVPNPDLFGTKYGNSSDDDIMKYGANYDFVCSLVYDDINLSYENFSSVVDIIVSNDFNFNKGHIFRDNISKKKYHVIVKDTEKSRMYIEDIIRWTDYFANNIYDEVFNTMDIFHRGRSFKALIFNEKMEEALNERFRNYDSLKFTVTIDDRDRIYVVVE